MFLAASSCLRDRFDNSVWKYPARILNRKLGYVEGIEVFGAGVRLRCRIDNW